MGRADRNSVSSSDPRHERVGLVGCVKRKLASRAPARDLYVSTPFLGRRRYVEATCSRWYVLSARHCVVDPRQLIDPYDQSLTDASAGHRRSWSFAVLRALDQEVTDHRTVTYEIHAGAAYRDYGLIDGLLARGAGIDVPAAGLSQGQQLQFYKRGPSAADRGELGPDPIAPTLPDPSVQGRPAPTRATSAVGFGGKYAPLATWLRELTAPTVDLTFTTIERLLGNRLPASARRHRAWWANDPSHSQAAAWTASGWAVAHVDLASGTVRFERRSHG